MDMRLLGTDEMRDKENQVRRKQMLAWIERLLTAPVFEDEDRTRVASLLNIILLAALAMTGMVGIGLLFTSLNSLPGLVAVGLLVLSEWGALFLLRRGRVRFASWLLSCLLAVFFMAVTFLFGGVRISSFSSYVVVILISALLLGGRAGALFAGLGSVAGLGILYAEIAGLLPPSPMPITPAFTWTTVTAAFIMTAVLLHLATHGLSDALEDARRNARALAESNRQLQREIADRVQTGEALRESEEKYRNLVERASDGIAIVQDTQLKYVNPRLAEMAGYTIEELIATPFTDYIYPDELPKVVDRYKRRMTGEEVASVYETVLEHRDGSRIDVELNAGMITYKDRPADLVLVRDITRRKQAEGALQAYAARLERSNRDLQDFVHVASHDLQEPLRKVQALGDRLQAKYGESLDDRGRDYLERIQNAAARMQTQIKDLLMYAQVATSVRSFVPVDLARMVREVVSDLEARIEESGGRVEVGDLLSIEADPTQMRQLMQHLIGNALKFHRDGEPPVVKIRAEHLNGQAERWAGNSPDDGLCRIMVEDNGIGFDNKYADRIFWAFEQLHSRGKYEGTGMGLAICRKIAERHGGSITAESVPGQGATFIVTLPVKQSKGENV
jgi:two-component system sensor kinase FixL